MGLGLDLKFGKDFAHFGPKVSPRINLYIDKHRISLCNNELNLLTSR